MLTIENKIWFIVLNLNRNNLQTLKKIPSTESLTKNTFTFSNTKAFNKIIETDL